ncbi:MAG: DUF123 domain-containing protein [Candidatus Binatia bacterium]
MSQGQPLPPIYHLVLRLPETRSLRVGSLGPQSFPHGYYVYTGRARRGLASRLKRHLRMEKTNHWHIDWLTKVAQMEEIWVDFRPEISECESHRLILSVPDANRPFRGFGSSDCRCHSHLAHFDKMPIFLRKGKPTWRRALVRVLGSAKR